jgi:hypothetical protein
MNNDDMMLAVQTLSSGVLNYSNPEDYEIIKSIKEKMIHKNLENIKVFIDALKSVYVDGSSEIKDDKFDISIKRNRNVILVRDYISFSVQVLSASVISCNEDGLTVALAKEIIKNGYEFLSLIGQKYPDVD